jgi:hypothetical protein
MNFLPTTLAAHPVAHNNTGREGLFLFSLRRVARQPRPFLFLHRMMDWRGNSLF